MPRRQGSVRGQKYSPTRELIIRNIALGFGESESINKERFCK
jgi:hypothetical protein